MTASASGIAKLIEARCSCQVGMRTAEGCERCNPDWWSNVATEDQAPCELSELVFPVSQENEE